MYRFSDFWPESPTTAAPTFRGLDGLGSLNQLNVDMPDGTTQMFYGVVPALDQALQAGGKPRRPDLVVNGATVTQGYYIVTTFLGGYLFDGCPLNIIFGQGWLPGQQTALQNAGIQPACAQLMTPAAPQQNVQFTSLQAPVTSAAATNPISAIQAFQAPGYTNTLTTGGMVTTPAPVAPSQTVYSGQAPIIPVGSTSSPSMLPPGTPLESPISPLPLWPIAAIVVLVLLMRKIP